MSPPGTQAPMSAVTPAPPDKALADDLMESETPMPPTDSTTLPVLVVGATGSLGSKVVDELLRRGKNVLALVRPATDAAVWRSPAATCSTSTRSWPQ